ncbi:hypothetical protein MM300_10660 [Evansella sp. LMS18]|uniref:hypothetical protein n=1 Tax=Evansella sp. LMS18 TaxID=2924033 RepID=UPI0020D1024F|nr:hypothetical protein [Evansella sp. LMS18]UTR12696.1 hypothetical protein MM300_10660 [Evansella sp. LMS18]
MFIKGLSIAAVFLTGIMLVSACGQTDTDEYQEETGAGNQEGQQNDGNGDKWEEAFNADHHYTEEVVKTYFLQATDETIELNISEARADYHFEELGADGVDDMLYSLSVRKTGDLEIVDTEGEELSVNDLHEGDIIYLEYDISAYDRQSDHQFETDLLVKEAVSSEEMLRNVAPPEGSDELYIGIVSEEGEGWGGLDETDLEFLFEYEAVRGFGDIIHRPGVPAYDYVEAFGIDEELPVFFIVSEAGLEYQSDDLDEIVEFIESW